MKTQHLKIITLIFLIFLGCYMLYRKEQQVSSLEWNTKIRALQKENTSLSKKNKMLDRQIHLLEQQRDSLTQAITMKEKRLENLKHLRDEKISTIEHYTNDELYLFFARINTDSTSVE